LEGQRFTATLRGRRVPLSTRLLGDHQIENAGLALLALDAARERVPVDEEATRRGFAAARWPGRLDVVSRDPVTILDGAHNPAGAMALAEHLKARGLKPVLVFGALADKDWSAMVMTLAPHARDAIVTRVPSPRAAEPQDVARAFSMAGIFGMVVDEPGHALRTAEGIAGPDGLVLVTGSLYLVGDILGRLAP
jgi:dihydrofolate synthase/folylpolyglutamate synthase